MEKTKRIGFFKRLKMSLFELENYIEFMAEKTSKAINFVMKAVIAFALIMFYMFIANMNHHLIMLIVLFQSFHIKIIN